MQRRSILVLALTAAGCVVEGGQDVVTQVDPARTPVLPECGGGQFVRRTADGAGWECAAAVDSATVPVVPSCGAGEFVRRTESGWECRTPEASAVLPSCSAGETPERLADGGWGCRPAPACPDGSVLRALDGGWSCARLAPGDVAGFDVAARAALGAKEDANPLHHDRYTDDEAVAAVHAAGVPWGSVTGAPQFAPQSHGHAPGEVVGLDAAARAAMGAKGPANPLHHDRYTDAEAVAAVRGAGVPWTSVSDAPDFAARAHSHSSMEVTDFGPAARTAMGAKDKGNPHNHDRYTDAEAVAAVAASGTFSPKTHGHVASEVSDFPAAAKSAMGAKDATNPYHHDRYTDSEAVAAVTAGGIPWSSVKNAPAFAAQTHAHVASDTTDFAAAAKAAMGAKDRSNPYHHDRYTDAEAVEALRNSGPPWTAGTAWPGTVAADRIPPGPGPNLVPVGTIHAFAGRNAPDGYLLCNGAEVSKTTFAALYAVVQDMYGSPVNSANFKLPDLRGEFLRGNDNGREVDPQRSLGSTQAATEIFSDSGAEGRVPEWGGWAANADPAVKRAGVSAVNLAGMAHGNAERTYAPVRPRNVSVNFIIKY